MRRSSPNFIRAILLTACKAQSNLTRPARIQQFRLMFSSGKKGILYLYIRKRLRLEYSSNSQNPTGRKLTRKPDHHRNDIGASNIKLIAHSTKSLGRSIWIAPTGNKKRRET